MRFIFTSILIIFFAGIAEQFCPWWVISAVCFVFAFLTDLQAWKAFFSGALAIAILWLTVALWRDIPNEHILSDRMALLFKLPSHGYFILVTVLVGSIVGGFSAWSGILVRKMF